MILLECQNEKIFLQNVTPQTGLKKIKKVKKKLSRGHILLMVLMETTKMFKHFTKNNYN